MAQYKTPDVYVQEKSTLPPSVAEVATAIPVFVGYTEKTFDSKKESIVQKPIRITNIADYRAVFGGKAAESFSVYLPHDRDGYVITSAGEAKDAAKTLPSCMLAQSVEHFIANGGGACYVVSTGNYETAPAKSDFINALDVISAVDEITLLCLVDAHALPAGDYYDLQSAALAQCSKLKDRFTLIDVVESSTADLPSNQIYEDALALRDGVTGDLKYGAAYYPNLLTSYARSYTDAKVEVTYEKAVIVEATEEQEATTIIEQTTSKLSDLDSSTLEYNRSKKVLAKNVLTLPSSPAVAGMIAKVDGTRGVWKAPANVALSMVKMPSKTIKNSDQDALNVDVISGKSINAIRNFSGKGNLVWGARTLAGNDNEWRYVSVRRLFNMVEESIQKATAFAVFEPNTPFTWLKLKTMMESYLSNLWRQGALFGDTQDQAFFVNVGLGQTMTEDDINNGIMNIEIGLSAVRPAEFIVLTFSHKSIEG